MVAYSFYVFDRHAACIYKRKWLPTALQPTSTNGSTQSVPSSNRISASSTLDTDPNRPGTSDRAPPKGLSAEDDAKLLFGTIFSLRNMVRKLGGESDTFISYRTGIYKLHYYETPTGLKFVMVTDRGVANLRVVLHQIWVGLWIEYVVKNPLAPVDHPSDRGVECEMFDLGLEQFIGGTLNT
jgi:hypothetical protein